MWRRGVVLITTAQLHSTKPELRFCAGSNPARGVSEIRDGENLWQWSRLEIKLDAFRRSTKPQNQFISIISMNHELDFDIKSIFLDHPASSQCQKWSFWFEKQDLQYSVMWWKFKVFFNKFIYLYL